MKKLLLLTLVLLGGFSTAFADDTWTVAGTSAIFGTQWDATDTNNDMTQTSATVRQWEKENIVLYAGGEYVFKVVKNHSWDESYPTSNYVISVANTGVYTVTIKFYTDNPSYWDNNVTLTKTDDYDQNTYVVAGQKELLGGDGWKPADIRNKMTLVGDEYILEKEDVELTASTAYEYKVTKNYVWTDAKGSGDGNASVTAPSYSGTLTSDNYFVGFSFDGTNDPSAYALMQVKGVSLSQSDDIVGEKVTQNLRVSDGSVTINRTLHKGYWNTICLPTDMSEADLNTTFGSGKWKLAEFTGCTENNMNFSSVSSISNNTPYLLWLDENATNNASFTVNTDWLSRNDAKLTVNPNDADYKMIGTMAPATNLATNCLIIKEDKVYKSTGSSKVNAMSAYFEVPASGDAREFTFSVNGETTGIKFVVTGDKVENDNCKIYDLQGRQVENMQRGVYVVNGKKYVK